MLRRLETPWGTNKHSEESSYNCGDAELPREYLFLRLLHEAWRVVLTALITGLSVKCGVVRGNF